ncbi:hypothetical protein BSKO_00577 [Bryopsis sp. KO-2023]|nr:hypothetical protein BSKO_00577 [Bryopsis sp. KO-2023]
MSKKRGLSLEEKRERLLDMFHDTADVYVLKEVEKLGAKKGITLQTVKEVLQSLVDDDLVHQEKIGASNYFWAFPSEEAVRLSNDLRTVEGQLGDIDARTRRAKEALTQEKKGKENSKERTEKLRELEEQKQTLGKLEKDVAQYAENDPETVKAMVEACGVAKDAANRWLDNLYGVESWAKKQFQGREDELKKFFQSCGMSDDMDYLE